MEIPRSVTGTRGHAALELPLGTRKASRLPARRDPCGTTAATILDDGAWDRRRAECDPRMQ